MPNASPVKMTRTAMRGAAAPILAAVLAVLLAGCGSDKAEEELLQRVATAEAAAARADAARIRAEKAIEEIGSSSFTDEGDGSEEDLDAPEDDSLDVEQGDDSVEGEAAPQPAPDPAPVGRMPA